MIIKNKTEKSQPKSDKPKKRKFNPDVIPVQAKTYATLHRTLGGTRKF
jgi:hypothetical protein